MVENPKKSENVIAKTVNRTPRTQHVGRKGKRAPSTRKPRRSPASSASWTTGSLTASADPASPQATLETDGSLIGNAPLTPEPAVFMGPGHSHPGQENFFQAGVAPSFRPTYAAVTAGTAVAPHVDITGLMLHKAAMDAKIAPFALPQDVARANIRPWLEMFNEEMDRYSVPPSIKAANIHAHLDPEVAAQLATLSPTERLDWNLVQETLIGTFALTVSDDLQARRAALKRCRQDSNEGMSVFIAKFSKALMQLNRLRRAPMSSAESTELFVRNVNSYYRPPMSQQLGSAGYATLQEAFASAMTMFRARPTKQQGLGAVQVNSVGKRPLGNEWVDGKPICRGCTSVGHYLRDCPSRKSRKNSSQGRGPNTATRGSQQSKTDF
jgi:hypothetical protein